MSKENSKQKSNKLDTECVFCHGTGKATFVDMDKVPDYTNMIMGDKTWKKYEELGDCPKGCKKIIN